MGLIDCAVSFEAPPVLCSDCDLLDAPTLIVMIQKDVFPTILDTVCALSAKKTQTGIRVTTAEAGPPMWCDAIKKLEVFEGESTCPKRNKP